MHSKILINTFFTEEIYLQAVAGKKQSVITMMVFKRNIIVFFIIIIKNYSEGH